MKQVLAFLIFACALSVNFAAQATGHDQGGGGDLCEDRIKIIRDDLRDWITKGGPQGLTLPANLTVGAYSTWMLNQMNTSKIRCVAPADEGYPVNVNGTAKTCRFDLSAGQGLITCDYNKFLSANESDQYVLVHHEFAGLAGIETPNADDSIYMISNQIAGYLEDQVIKKLVVKPAWDDGIDPFDSGSCTGQPMSMLDAFHRIPLPNQTEQTIGSFKTYLRTRLCYAVDGCTAWSSVPTGSSKFLMSTFDDSPWVVFGPQVGAADGKIKVRLVNNQTELVLSGNQYKVVNHASDYAPSWMLSMFYSYNFQAPLSGEVRMIEDGAESISNQITFPGGQPLKFLQGTLTNHCVRLTSQGFDKRTDSSGNTVTDEYQAVILGLIQ